MGCTASIAQAPRYTNRGNINSEVTSSSMAILPSQTTFHQKISRSPLKINNNIQNRSLSPIRHITPQKQTSNKVTISPITTTIPISCMQQQPSRLPLQSQLVSKISNKDKSCSNITKQIKTQTINGKKTTKIITTQTITQPPIIY